MGLASVCSRCRAQTHTSLPHDHHTRCIPSHTCSCSQIRWPTCLRVCPTRPRHARSPCPRVYSDCVGGDAAARLTAGSRPGTGQTSHRPPGHPEPLTNQLTQFRTRSSTYTLPIRRPTRGVKNRIDGGNSECRLNIFLCDASVGRRRVACGGDAAGEYRFFGLVMSQCRRSQRHVRR